MSSTINLTDAVAVIDVFQRAAETMRNSPLRKGSAIRLPKHGRLLATGDLHDNPIHFEKIIRLARLDAGEDRHVVLHELIHGDKLINGMDFSHRMLTRVAALLLEHPLQVHPILANHELSQMMGTKVSKGAGDNVQLFLEALDFAFGESADEVAEAINEFFAAMPLALMSEDGVLCAHSLPNAVFMNSFDLDVLGRALTDEDYIAPRGSAYAMVWGRLYTNEQVEELAERWGVRLFCLGHQHVETGIEVTGPRVVVLNSDHERATVLPIDLANVPTAEEAIMAAIPLGSV